MAPFLLFSIAQKLLLPSFVGEFPVFEACRKKRLHQARSNCRQSCQIFPKDIEFDINLRAGLDTAEISIFVRIRDYRHLKRVIRRLANRQADSINRHGALVDRDISTLGELWRHFIFKSIIPAAVNLVQVRADRRRIDMTLHDVTVETAVNTHAALKIYEVADL